MDHTDTEAQSEQGADGRAPDAPSPDAPHAPATEPPRKRRRGLVWAGRLFGFAVLSLALSIAIVFFAARGESIRLPQALETQLLLRINEAIAAAGDGASPIGELRLDAAHIALPERGFRPELQLSNVQFRDAVGLRAFFPEVRLLWNGSALLGGELRLQRVRLDGAGMLLSRDETGALDLRLAPEAPRQDGGLAGTLDALDALFLTPAFAELEELSGQGLLVLINDAVTGRIIQSRDAALQVTREGEVLSLSVSGSVLAGRDATLDLNLRRDAAQGRTEMRAAFENLGAQDLATSSPAFAWLTPLRAPISGQVTGEIDDFGRPGDVLAEMALGAGVLSTAGQEVAFDGLQAALSYDAVSEVTQFTWLSLSSEDLSFTATGQVLPVLGEQALVAQLQLADIQADPNGFFERPLTFGGGAVDVQVHFAPDDLRVQIGQLSLFDGPMRAHLSGEVRIDGSGVSTRLDAHVPQIEAGALMAYWPETLAPGTRRYLSERLTSGQLSDIAWALRRGPAHEDAVAVRFDFQDMTLAALPDMPPITQGAGYLSVLDRRLAVHLTEGQLRPPDGGVIDLSGTTMRIEEMRREGALAEFDLALSGALPDFGTVLARPPVNLLANSDRAPSTLARGWAEVDVDLDLTLRRQMTQEDVAFRASGRFLEVASDTLVEGRVLTADRLSFDLTPEVLSLAGAGALDGVPFTGRWSRVLGPEADGGSRAEARVTLTNAHLETLGVRLPPGFVSGTGAADLTLELDPDAPPRLQLRSDLSGLGLALPTLGWRHGQNATGSLEAELRLGEAPSVDRLSLQAAGMDLEGAVRLDQAGGFDRMTFERFRLDGWLDLQGALVGRGAGQPPLIEITGGRIDMTQRPRLAGAGTAGGGPGPNSPPIRARLERVALADDVAITGFQAELSQGMSGSFSGRVNGITDLQGVVLRDSNGLGLNLTTGDAGAALRASGLFANGYGGALALRLRAAAEPGSYFGDLDIDGMRIRDAPAMAELLNIISVVGLLDQLSDEGINLGDIEARFRIVPGAILLDEASAVGPALGLSMDGIYQTAEGRYDMQGVVSPIYVLNGALGALFAERREGLIGVSYQVTGVGDQAQVTANPLSILTPGILRDIFRRPNPTAP